MMNLKLIKIEKKSEKIVFQKRIRVSLFGLIFFQSVLLSAKPDLPDSTLITGVTWAPVEDIVRKANGSDNWPVTWADDDYLYTAYGDGFGFPPGVPSKLSMGFARISGTPPNFSGENIRSDFEQYGDGKSGNKASGILMVNGRLYLWIRNADNNGNESQLAFSDDHGKNWTRVSWKFKNFGYITFINFGKDYEGARDNYVYSVSPNGSSAYDPVNSFVLMRVPKDKITTEDAYEFLKSALGEPVWTDNIEERGTVFEHEGKCLRSGISYDNGLERYLWIQPFSSEDARFSGGTGIYEAPEPWGPWSIVFYTDSWDVGPGETASFPTKWMSSDGKTLYLVFSGDDAFSVRKVTFSVSNVPSTPSSPENLRIE